MLGSSHSMSNYINKHSRLYIEQKKYLSGLLVISHYNMGCNEESTSMVTFHLETQIGGKKCFVYNIS